MLINVTQGHIDRAVEYSRTETDKEGYWAKRSIHCPVALALSDELGEEFRVFPTWATSFVVERFVVGSDRHGPTLSFSKAGTRFIHQFDKAIGGGGELPRPIRFRATR